MKNKKQRVLEVEKAKKKKASIQRGERASGKVKRVGVRAALDKVWSKTSSKQLNTDTHEPHGGVGLLWEPSIPPPSSIALKIICGQTL